MSLNILDKLGTVQRNVKITGDFEINQLHMSVNLAHQLLHARGILFVGTRGILNEGRRLREGDLLRIP